MGVRNSLVIDTLEDNEAHPPKVGFGSCPAGASLMWAGPELVIDLTRGA